MKNLLSLILNGKLDNQYDLKIKHSFTEKISKDGR